MSVKYILTRPETDRIQTDQQGTAQVILVVKIKNQAGCCMLHI